MLILWLPWIPPREYICSMLGMTHQSRYPPALCASLSLSFVTPTNQVLDLNQVELLYGSSFFKSIETGGNVSKALVGLFALALLVTHDTFCPQTAASKYACYNSVVSSNNQLLLLGIQSLHMVTLKPWKEVPPDQISV